MYYFPKKVNSLPRVNPFKSALDRISGNHCLLLPQKYDNGLGKEITYSLFTTSPPISLDELWHVGSITPDPVRYISRSSFKLKKKNHSYLISYWWWMIRFVILTNLDTQSSKTKWNYTIISKKFLEVAILTDLVNFEVSMHIYIMIILARGTRRLPMN